MNGEFIPSLERLARLYRVATAFRDGFGVLRRTSPEAILAILRSLGAPLDSLEDVSQAVRQRRRESWENIAEPVTVSWAPEEARFSIRSCPDERILTCELKQENGAVQAWTVDLGEIPVRHASEVDGQTYVVRTLVLPDHLPVGYHRLHLQTKNRAADAWVLRAPRRTYPLKEVAKSGWGLFLPLYSLHTKRSGGTGDFTDLSDLSAWTGSLGGGLIGTLPLLAAYLDEPCDPSPYTPVSRLFWNELFVDASAAPEFEHCREARELAASAAFQADIDELRKATLVDYRRQMALKRRVLEALSSSLGASQRRVELEAYAAGRPALEAYARFRATTERRHKIWPEWPERQRNGRLDAGDYDEPVRFYHLYVQWLADTQLGALAEKSGQGAAGLYLDLPLGVHSGGFDVWRNPDLFARGIAGGAPPDRFFTKGQNWGFAPLHPEQIRLEGYRYFIASLRHHMRYCDVLRIDHVMNLHRLYWVPEGFSASDGAYVGYQAEELYAVLAIESRRHGTAIIGEDLGTVPSRVRTCMQEHAISGMYVAQFEFGCDPHEAIGPTPENSLASLNTHDMRPFAGFWNGLDIQDQEELGLIAPEEAGHERERRATLKNSVVQYLRERGGVIDGDPTLQQVLEGCLAELAARAEAMMLVNLEDLWLEETSQNTPGTVDERPNWRSRARYGLGEIKAMREIEELLKRVHDLRQNALS